MKQVFFILLVFISIQGFSQSVKVPKIESIKVPKIGLEVMKEDLGEMNWDEAIKACKNLGGAWRLPTLDELIKIYENRESIGDFASHGYWSSNEMSDNFAWFYSFTSMKAYYDPKNQKGTAYYVRAVRTLI
jgi:hypothetical protein